MAEAGVDISRQYAKTAQSLIDAGERPADTVITVCDETAGRALPGVSGQGNQPAGAAPSLGFSRPQRAKGTCRRREAGGDPAHTRRDKARIEAWLREEA